MSRLTAALRITLCALVTVLLTANSGCLINQYSSEPTVRMQQLLYQSEDLRQIGQEWRRFWFNDPPAP